MEEDNIHNPPTGVLALSVEHGGNGIPRNERVTLSFGTGMMHDMMGMTVSSHTMALVEEVETLRAELARVQRLVDDPLPTYWDVQAQGRISSSARAVGG